MSHGTWCGSSWSKWVKQSARNSLHQINILHWSYGTLFSHTKNELDDRQTSWLQNTSNSDPTSLGEKSITLYANIKVINQCLLHHKRWMSPLGHRHTQTHSTQERVSGGSGAWSQRRRRSGGFAAAASRCLYLLIHMNNISEDNCIIQLFNLQYITNPLTNGWSIYIFHSFLSSAKGGKVIFKGH